MADWRFGGEDAVMVYVWFTDIIIVNCSVFCICFGRRRTRGLF